MSLKGFVSCSADSSPFLINRQLSRDCHLRVPITLRLHLGTPSRKHRLRRLVQSHLPLPDLIHRENRLQIVVLQRAVPALSQRLGCREPAAAFGLCCCSGERLTLAGWFHFPAHALPAQSSRLNCVTRCFPPPKKDASVNASVHESRALHAGEKWSCTGFASWAHPAAGCSVLCLFGLGDLVETRVLLWVLDVIKKNPTQISRFIN